MVGIRNNKSDIEICFAGLATENEVIDKLKQMYQDGNPFTLRQELAEPIITDISDLIPDGFTDIEVEAGGSVTFKQSDDLQLPVPNQETWMIKLGGTNT